MMDVIQDQCGWGNPPPPLKLCKLPKIEVWSCPKGISSGFANQYLVYMEITCIMCRVPFKLVIWQGVVPRSSPLTMIAFAKKHT